ncbi:MAG TPA: dihydropteroate synthase [Acidiphilium sp.]|nr:dihydropteroate synthase [Acidiphilium sp.]HQU23360.1 dihydropteroate synthase [Acidiphilium sp.]
MGPRLRGVARHHRLGSRAAARYRQRMQEFHSPPDAHARTQHWAGFSLDRPLVMGILNVTPDSFSDGGAHGNAEAAIIAGQAMRAAGADIIDIGGESTRPGAVTVLPDEEIRRVVPVIAGLAAQGAVISVDTRNAATMAAALDAGARIVNDVSALRHDPAAAGLVAARGCPVVLMHSRGTPETMNCHAHYADLVRDVTDELAERSKQAMAAGVARAAIALDPGFGFAKVGEQNFALLRGLRCCAALGFPLLVGVSRKRFLGEAMGQPSVPTARDPASLAAGLFALREGAAILRVHDVSGTVQAARVWGRLAAPSASAASG